jgi:hypothetical protein
MQLQKVIPDNKWEQVEVTILSIKEFNIHDDDGGAILITDWYSLF